MAGMPLWYLNERKRGVPGTRIGDGLGIADALVLRTGEIVTSTGFHLFA